MVVYGLEVHSFDVESELIELSAVDNFEALPMLVSKLLCEDCVVVQSLKVV